MGAVEKHPLRDDFGQALVEWTDFLRAVEGRAPGTVGKYSSVVSGLQASLGGKAPREVTYGDLEAYVKSLYYRGFSSSTRAVAVAAIRSFWRYLGARGLIEASPARHLRAPRVYRRERPTLTTAEIHRLVFGSDERLLPTAPLELRNRVLIYVMYIAGLRRSEVGGLLLDDLRWDVEIGVASLLVRGAKSAAGDVRLTLDRDGSRAIATYIEVRTAVARTPNRWLFPAQHGGHLGTDRVRQIFRARLSGAGIRPQGRRLTPHILRHSLATHLLAAGWTIKQVQQRLRHASIATTSVYLHADRESEARHLDQQHPLRAKRRRTDRIGPAVAALLEDFRRAS